MSTLLFLQGMHGHVAILGVALAFHPVFALRRARRPARRTRVAGYLATAFIAATNVAGWVIYPAYRHEIKRQLYAANTWWGRLFEIKEHLGWYVLALALAGGVLMSLSNGPQGDILRRPIRVLYTAAGVLGLVVGGIGTYLASIKGFGYPI